MWIDVKEYVKSNKRVLLAILPWAEGQLLGQIGHSLAF